MPGLRFKLWPIFGVKKFPWVQVPAGEIGVVIAQVGEPLPIGAKSAVYKPEFGTSPTLETFIDGGGQKGVQRPVLTPGTLLPIHPVAFMVVTVAQGLRASRLARHRRAGARRPAAVLRPESFGLTPEQLQVVVIAPRGPQDMIGIVTTLEGPPLPSGDIASRLGGYDDIAAMEQQAERRQDSEVIEVLLGAKNDLHNNYQDFQAFLDAGGHIGLQHDPLLYGAYLLNPFLVARRDGADARREPGRGRGHQGVRRPADARHVGRGVQVRFDRASRSPRHLAASRCAPASTRSTRVCTRPRSCRRRS